VADVLDLPLGTTKARLAYGLASLRKRLREQALTPAPPPRRPHGPEGGSA
jgi:hypothetical protein